MTNRRGRLTRRASVQLENLFEEEKTFRLPKFVPISTRYKKIEEKREKEEKIKLLRKKKKIEEGEVEKTEDSMKNTDDDKIQDRIQMVKKLEICCY